MISKTRTSVLLGTSVVAAMIGGLMLGWSPAPSAADAVVQPVPIQPHKPTGLKRAQVGPMPTPPPSMPAALTGMPPQEVWLPRALSDQDKATRVAADQVHMQLLALSGAAVQNASFLQDELVNARYDAIESQLDAVVALSKAHPEYEFVERDATTFAEASDHSNEAGKYLLDAWLKQRPQSGWAHYAQAIRWYNEAAALMRGWDEDMPPELARKVQQDYENARFEARKAAKLKPDSLMAWTTLLDADRTLKDLAGAKQDYRQAVSHRPYSYLIDSAMAKTLARSGLGSDQMEDDFAESLAPSFQVNPWLRTVRGFATADRACVHCNHTDWQTGLKLFNRALAYSDVADWLEDAGDAAARLGRYALAYQYYERAGKYRPDSMQDAMELQLLHGRCDPKLTELQFRSLIDTANNYGGIEKIDYPRRPGDCVYYEAELPWGDEPVPDPGDTQSYSIQVEMLKAAAEAKRKH